MLLKDIVDEELEVELGAMGTKYRWQVHREDQVIEDQEGEGDEVDEEAQMEIEAKLRMPHDMENSIYDGGKLRSTDMSENASVKLPMPIAPQQEAELAIRSEMIRSTVKEYRNMKNITKKQHMNLTKLQKTGLDTIKARIKSGDYIVMKTDKTGTFAVASREAYLAMGQVPVAGDRIVDNRDIGDIQNKVVGHTSMLARILKLGVY